MKTFLGNEVDVITLADIREARHTEEAMERRANCPHNRKRVTRHFEKCLDCEEVWGLPFAVEPSIGSAG